ncbi:hypothetical protein AB6A40_003796 [Gnathostoma spinigerum]|uniref:Uncharacterized protein n=1 Tax=Gnathostoma spinigerum TaxID=75299 RepID=A0ABD6EK57_9BILA
MGENRKLLEYFVIAGLEEGAEDFGPSAQECGCRNSVPLAPVTDICVIFPGLGETVPEGFECIESTPLGYPADLNHGSLRTPSVFLCFRRGYHKPPLVDIGVLDEGRGEKPMLDSNPVLTTPFGRPANVNNASQGVFLTYRRAQPNSAPSQLVVTHICVILTNKGESPPHTYYKISKNLNKGMVGSDVFVCYKKSQGISKRLAYKPAVLDCFPSAENFSLAQNIPMFCLPMGALIECWPAKCQPPDKSFSTFVLTDQDGSKFYGASVTFYEQYEGKLTDEQLEKLDIGAGMCEGSRGAVEDTSNTNDPAEKIAFYTNISICIISRYPFFNPFKRFLFHLHRMSVSGSYSVPVERYISHLMFEVSFPSVRCPRVLVQLGNETVSLENHDDSQLPLSGAAIFDTLKCLGPDNLMYLMLLALLEQKVLIHSLRPWLLTAVAESVCALMFPFHWQCPYIPQCPLSLAGVLHAPLPFIAGVDSRYFDLYEDPPSDVTCFDLDTSTISSSTVRQTVKLSLFPKKEYRQLRSSLEKLHRRLYQEEFTVIAMRKNMDFMPIDVDYQIQRKKRMLEVSVQDAFLRFMASLMRGYTSHLRPIRSAPRAIDATDTGSLFDLGGFLRSRDKSSAEFFKRFSETQSFNRFIEERSFISDKNAYNAFFDTCIAKVDLDAERAVETPLLDVEISSSCQTEFTPPPEPLLDCNGKELSFTYGHFPQKLKRDLFQFDELKLNNRQSGEMPIDERTDRFRNSLIRTKQESRCAIEAAASNMRAVALSWPKTLLFYGYSLWFLLLPSLLHLASSKVKMLRLALHVLNRLEESGVVPLDQTCYRTVIFLCGEYGQPMLAVRVLQAMQRCNLEANAVTYGLYHQAVLKAKWPPMNRQQAVKAWIRLSSLLRGVTYFRYNLVLCSQRRLSMQISDTMSSVGSKSEKNQQNVSEEPMQHDVTSHATNDASTRDTEATMNNGNAELDSMKPATAVFLDSIDAADTSDVVRPNADGPDDNDVLEDPLGAFRITTDKTNKNIKAPPKLMSPSRAKFIKEHSESPFSHSEQTDETLEPNAQNLKPGSWLRGLTNSPIVSRLMRSHTTGNFDTTEDQNAALTISPSLSSLVSQMKKHAIKGYDGVVQSSNLSSRLRSGVSSFVNEVRNLNRSYGRASTGSTGSCTHEDQDDILQDLDVMDPAFQLDSGMPSSLLPSEWWISDQLESLVSSSSNFIDITLGSPSVCPSCKMIIYDEDLMAGWTPDESNLNTTCPYCQYLFVPSLTVKIRSRKFPTATSWYFPSRTIPAKKNDHTTDLDLSSSSDDQLSVPFISPLVLRRELESLLSENHLSMTDPSLKQSHPIIFWNLLYYTRRLSLPSHLPSWLGCNVHVRCVYDVPEMHTSYSPLYFANPSHQDDRIMPSDDRMLGIWRHVIDSLQQSSILRALKVLITENIRNSSGRPAPHFPLFRDIQFVALDRFGSAVDRDQLDQQYKIDFERLPPRIISMLPFQDRPPSIESRACRKIFMPLDLI